MLTQEQIDNIYKYADTFIHKKWGKIMNWCIDDLIEDFAESVITNMLKGISYNQALWYGKFDIIDIIRRKRYYYSSWRRGKIVRRYHYRISYMATDLYEEFHNTHSYNPEDDYIDTILIEQLLLLMGNKEQAAWRLKLTGLTQEEIAKRDQVGRSMISKRLTKGVAQVREQQRGDNHEFTKKTIQEAGGAASNF